MSTYLMMTNTAIQKCMRQKEWQETDKVRCDRACL